MKAKHIAALVGFSLGMFTLAVMFTAQLDARRMAYSRLESERLEDFKEWSEEICHGGYSIAEFMESGEYKVVCN